MSDYDALWMLVEVFPGTSTTGRISFRADPEHTEGLYTPSGLDSPLGSPRRSWRKKPERERSMIATQQKQDGFECLFPCWYLRVNGSAGGFCERQVCVKHANAAELRFVSVIIKTRSSGDDALYWILSPRGSYKWCMNYFQHLPPHSQPQVVLHFHSWGNPGALCNI